jgi:pyruvate kinase
MARYTRIICTLGPASMSEEMLVKMAKRGMDVVRINTSHGDQNQHQKMINLVRSVNKKHKFVIKVLIDLEGYRIRIGHLKEDLKLEAGKTVYMKYSTQNEIDFIPFDYKENIKKIPKGAEVFIDDGDIQLKVLACVSDKLKLKVIVGGVLKNRKGINIPQLKLKSNILTEKDKKCIQFGIKNKVEYFAHSFVRNEVDIQKVSDLVKPYLPEVKIIAKIESGEGVENLEAIVDACDGVMVARGDLGVSLPIHKIPMMQKYIINHCNRKKKISITATQMLDSMIENGRPTRAEVSDVANAILDGSDYVMLSGESAVGRYPSRSIMMMSQILEYTEKHHNLRPYFAPTQK